MKRVLFSGAVLSLLALSIPAVAQDSVKDDWDIDRCGLLIAVNPGTQQQTTIGQSVDYNVTVTPRILGCAQLEEIVVSYRTLTPDLSLLELGGNPDVRLTPGAGAQYLSKFAIDAQAVDFDGVIIARASRQVTLLVIDGAGDPRPDLITQSFTGPSTAVEGSSVRFDGVFKNIGQQSAGQTFSRVTINGDSFGSRYCGVLAPGATCTGAWIWTAGTPGTYIFEVCADVNQQVDEADETNNCESRTLEVTAVPRPDLVGQFINCPATVQVGDTVPLTVGLRNIGNAPAGAFDFEIEGIVGSCPALQPGNQCQKTVYWTPTSAGAHVLTLEADSTNAVAESNEGNNSFSKTINVLPGDGPDFYFDVDGLLISPSAPSVGDTVTVTTVLKNGGDPHYGSVRFDVLFGGQGRTFYCYDLGTGETCTKTHTIQIPSAGNQIITAVADPLDQIAESHENNNSRSLNFVVSDSVTCAGTWTLTGIGHAHTTSSVGSVVNDCYVYFGQNSQAGCYRTTAPIDLTAIWTPGANGCPTSVEVTDTQGGEWLYSVSIN